MKNSDLVSETCDLISINCDISQQKECVEQQKFDIFTNFGHQLSFTIECLKNKGSNTEFVSNLGIVPLADYHFWRGRLRSCVYCDSVATNCQVATGFRRIIK